ncbi:MAG: 5'-methylthioadenosine/S-adenosylhomocysteine nucleosidase [Dehalococcoidia bacterium]|nr:5'-methylthioadenosine/S-adenosylhomocysteine nucleosidase [Dehalococcoidia bacterium]
MSILVVAPITAEFEALAGAFDERWGSPVLREAGRVAVREYEAAGVILAEGGFGKVQYAVTTRHLLDHLPDVDLVICAGVAGGLSEEVRVGDVVVATATVEHDFYSEVLRRVPPRIDGSGEHLTLLAGAVGAADAPFRVYFAPIASGDEGISDRDRKEDIRVRTDALAVAFEGAGGARAALFSNVPYLEVRGISDMAEGDILTELEANLPDVMANVATIVARLAAP